MSFDRPPPTALAGRGRVTTLGMLIIDHFEVHDESGAAVPADDPILGGGGIYATCAARMFLPPSHVGFIADVGPDFPPAFRAQLEQLGPMVWFRARDGPTTRALNMYSGRRVGEGRQTFKYLVPRLNIAPLDYFDPACPVGGVEWMHVVCDITRAEAILKEVDDLRAKGWNGKLAWEPLIRSTEGSETATYAALASRFDIFSPNHLELQAILNSTDDVETNARAFAALCPTPIAVRAGENGAYALSKEWSGWVPAYWRPGEEGHIVDVTGGGNAFMGGMLAGMVLTGDFGTACIYGSTAASYAIQQRGIPRLSTSESGELWNDSDVWDRLKEMARRTLA